MTPDKLSHYLTTLGSAADVVEAIDNPSLQQHRGWDLSCWRYRLVPFGVRFTYEDVRTNSHTEILALMSFASSPELVLTDSTRL